MLDENYCDITLVMLEFVWLFLINMFVAYYGKVYQILVKNICNLNNILYKTSIVYL